MIPLHGELIGGRKMDQKFFVKNGNSMNTKNDV